MTVKIINIASKHDTKDMLVPPANLEHQGYRDIYWQAEKNAEKVFWDPQRDDSAYGKYVIQARNMNNTTHAIKTQTHQIRHQNKSGALFWRKQKLP